MNGGMTLQRVVVTGMGTVNPLGHSVAETVATMDAGKIGIRPITKFDAEKTGITVAGEVEGFKPEVRMEKRLSKRLDLFTQYGLYSAIEAYEQSGLTKDDLDSERMAVIFGSGIGGLTTIQEQVTKMNAKGPDRVSPLFVPEAISNMVAGTISQYFGAHGPSYVVVTACASATNAIGEAAMRIQSGKADVVITGGAEASVNEIGIAGFAALSALSKAADPAKASLPFAADRSGFVLGEGGGAIILESLEHAQQRGANILGEVVGYGATSDAYHMTAPDPSGHQAARAMELAIEEAGIAPSDVGYINAHGTATKANDAMESKAIHDLFGDDVLVSSTKALTGHLLGAAGAIEAIMTISALHEGKLPINVGDAEQDPECPVTLVDAANRDVEVDYALSNSFGFGGHNAVLAFKRW